MYLSFHVSVSSNSECGCQGFGSVRRLHPIVFCKGVTRALLYPLTVGPGPKEMVHVSKSTGADGRSKGSLGQ